MQKKKGSDFLIIHTVGVGDTVFNIARKYGISPQKIIETNELLNPDRLTVGEKLVIFLPTRTYTVRGRDTLNDIANRFAVSINALMRKNPHLSGTESLYPGQILTIKGPEPKYGLGIANGYFFKGAKEDRLNFALPYLSYLTIGALKRNKRGFERLFDCSHIAKKAIENNVVPLLRIYDNETDFDDDIRMKMIEEANKTGCHGITVASYRGMREEKDKTEKHIEKLREMAKEQGMKLFLELDGNGNHTHSDIADGYILFYDKCAMPEIPSFEEGEKQVFEKHAENCGAEKTFIDISSAAFAGDEALGKDEAVYRAHSAGQEIKFDNSLLINSFNYNRYLGGKRNTVRVAYETPENIKAKLDLIRELGFLGISFDIMQIPTEYLLMFDELFSHPEIYPEI